MAESVPRSLIAQIALWVQQREYSNLSCRLVYDQTISDEQFALLVAEYIDRYPNHRVIANYLVENRVRICARKAWNDKLDRQFVIMDDMLLLSGQRCAAKVCANSLLETPFEQRYLYHAS